MHVRSAKFYQRNLFKAIKRDWILQLIDRYHLVLLGRTPKAHVNITNIQINITDATLRDTRTLNCIVVDTNPTELATFLPKL